MGAPGTTPGPWNLRGDEIESADGQYVCHFGGVGFELPDAHQIAASGALYDALKLLADNVEQAWPQLAELGPLVQARAALAQARGETPSDTGEKA